MYPGKKLYLQVLDPIHNQALRLSWCLSCIVSPCQSLYAETNELCFLEPIHSQVLRLCLGAYHTSPSQSFYAETYELSLNH